MLRKKEYERMKKRVVELLEEGLTAVVIAERLGCSLGFIYEIKRERKGEE